MFMVQSKSMSLSLSVLVIVSIVCSLIDFPQPHHPLFSLPLPVHLT